MNKLNAIASVAIAAAVATFTWSAGALADEPKLSNKWRIEVSEGANSDGTIRFLVTPEGGAPTEVAVAIKDGRGENGVADDIRDAFRTTLDPESFHAETDDGENVLLKKKHGAPDFALELVASSVKSVRLDIEKE
jgi:hypothetical protein